MIKRELVFRLGYFGSKIDYLLSVLEQLWDWNKSFSFSAVKFVEVSLLFGQAFSATLSLFFCLLVNNLDLLVT